MHHLGPVLSDAPLLLFFPLHEAGDVLQKQQRNLALAAQLNEVRRLESGLGKQHAIVSDDADQVAVNARKASDQSRAVAGLELVQTAAIDQTGEQFVDIVRDAGVTRDHAVQLGRVIDRLFRLLAIEWKLLSARQILEDRAGDLQGV